MKSEQCSKAITEQNVRSLARSSPIFLDLYLYFTVQSNGERLSNVLLRTFVESKLIAREGRKEASRIRPYEFELMMICRVQSAQMIMFKSQIVIAYDSMQSG